MINRWMRLLAVVALLLAPGTIGAVEAPPSTPAVSTGAEITALEGQADLIDASGQVRQVLKKGDTLAAGNRLRTGKRSRLEIQLPDASFLRFGEETTFQLTSAMLDSGQQRDVSVRMGAGKVWANVSRLFSKRGRFAISTKTAVAGVRGTTYRMNVNPDQSAVVKVYEGEVLVKRRTEAAETAAPVKPLEAPKPIPGPRPVSMEEWVYLVRSLQQINIRPDGTATKPFRFDIRADENDWVRWNRARDEAVTPLKEAITK